MLSRKGLLSRVMRKMSPSEPVGSCKPLVPSGALGFFYESTITPSPFVYTQDTLGLGEGY